MTRALAEEPAHRLSELARERLAGQSHPHWLDIRIVVEPVRVEFAIGGAIDTLEFPARGGDAASTCSSGGADVEAAAAIRAVQRAPMQIR